MAYIDPITGAYVENSLDALPPGYNQPKAGNESNVAKMRAQLNSEEALRQQQAAEQAKSKYLSDPTGLARFAMERMPGAGLVQGLMPSILAPAQIAGSAIYGVGNQIANPKTSNFNADTAKAMQAMYYTPPTQAGRDISEGVAKFGEAVGPLPELWVPQRGRNFTPDDLRVAGKTAIEDIRNFPLDYANAQQGLTRDYPTLGSRTAGLTRAAGDVARPLAEKAYNMYMDPDSSVEVRGISPFSTLDGLMAGNQPMYAVKPKGGNWPTNLGSTLPLKEQGEFGKHLSQVQYSDPLPMFLDQIKTHYPRSIQNRELLNSWEDYLYNYLKDYAKGEAFSDPYGPAMTALKNEAANKFAIDFNSKLAEGDKPLHTVSDIEKVLPAYNSWIMGPYQKYMTNQLGTGLATDPLLQAVNESGMPVDEIFGLRHEVPEYTQDSGGERRRSFVNTITNYGTNASAVNALENSPVGKITATTPSGVSYENLLDMTLYPKGTYAFTPEEGFPISAKLDDNALITDFLNEPVEHTGFSKIRNQVFQDLMSGNISPDKLSNVTPATVTRQMIKDKMAEFKEKQLSKEAAAEWVPKRAAAMPTDMAFDDGSKMTIITPEMAKTDEAMTARDLGQITIDLNQCVGAGCHATQDYPGHGPYLVPHTGKPPRGKVEYDKYGYLRRLKNGDIEIASLKDKKGVSQATIELKLKKLSLNQKEDLVYDWLSLNYPEAKIEHNANVRDVGQEEAVRKALQKYPELKELINQKTKKSIEQLKGADNGAVDSQFSPHLKDWLNKNANQLTDVRELKHVDDVYDLDNHYSSLDILTSKHPEWSIEAAEQLFHDAEDNKRLPRFFGAKEFEDLANRMDINLTQDPIHEDLNSPIVQKAYDAVSQQIVDTFEDDYVKEAFSSGNNLALNTIIREIEERPRAYGLGDFSPKIRQQVIQKLRNEASANNIANEAQNFEPEPAEQNQFNRLTELQASVIDDNMQNYFAGRDHLLPADMVEPYATDTRILMGNLTNPDAQLPPLSHRRLIDTLLDQDENTEDIRNAINQLQAQGAQGTGLTEAQAENALNILISWTERYPLNE